MTIMAGAGASEPAVAGGCGGAGTGTVIDGVRLDPEQLQNAQTIAFTTATRKLPVRAAVIAVDTAYTESNLHNTLTQTDHDSEGLFQQRVSLYTKAVADDPVKATNAFLDHLLRIPDWETRPVDVVAQLVQVSLRPDRYGPNVPLARTVVGQLWPAAAANTPEAQRPGILDATICSGSGGAGNNVAGMTAVPAGFVITGSDAGQQAVRFALAQLGEPYVFGAAGPDAWDCSGLTMGAWAAAGVPLPHFAATQATTGVAEPANLSQARGGDLVFIAGSDGTATAPGHVGMIAGFVDRDDGRHLYLIQAAMSGVPVELTETSQWRGQITAVRRIR